MRHNKMEKPLDPEDIGHLLEAKAKKLTRGEGDPERVIHDIVDTLGRSPSVRHREKTVDQHGRVSVGRDLAGTPGTTIFHRDPDAVDADGNGGDGQ